MMINEQPEVLVYGLAADAKAFRPAAVRVMCADGERDRSLLNHLAAGWFLVPPAPFAGEEARSEQKLASRGDVAHAVARVVADAVESRAALVISGYDGDEHVVAPTTVRFEVTDRSRVEDRADPKPRGSVVMTRTGKTVSAAARFLPLLDASSSPETGQVAARLWPAARKGSPK